ncbi:MAG TPA: hypothetical protein VFO19_04365 [Vicinamibacterales bacterium]|nr:hypothetical protein [Vicinamibacterales bacterium]
MTPTDDRRIADELEQRLRTMLPGTYQDRYDEVRPVSMGSSGLRFDADGKVAWNEIWGSFCDLALAGGPPHKGMLLEPASRREIAAAPDRHASVRSEICRGIAMVTELDAAPSADPGWVRVECLTRAMAAWLVRAITMENVAVRADGAALELPAGPDYRLEKEIKNVVTSIAKTNHYWIGHMSVSQWRAIAALFDGMAEESPAIAAAYRYDGPGPDPRARLADEAADAIRRETGLIRAPRRYLDWLGVECPTVRAAVWMTRTMNVLNVAARREHAALFMPINPATDPDARIVVSSVALAHRLAAAQGRL